MKRSFKVDHPFRSALIFLAVIGFCASNTLVSAVLCLMVASLSFATIIAQTMYKMRKKPNLPANRNVTATTAISLEKSPTLLLSQEPENAAVRRQIEALMAKVGYNTKNNDGQLPAPSDDPRMADLPKLRQSPKAHV